MVNSLIGILYDGVCVFVAQSLQRDCHSSDDYY